MRRGFWSFMHASRKGRSCCTELTFLSRRRMEAFSKTHFWVLGSVTK